MHDKSNPLEMHASRGDRRHQRGFAMSDSRGLKAPYIVWAALFVALSLIVLAKQQIDFDQASRIGLPIPDVVNITNTINISNFAGVDVGDLLGVAALYGWTWVIHPSLSFAVNLIFVTGSMRLHYTLATKASAYPNDRYVWTLLSPYILLAMVGPNKEIPLIFATLVVANAMADHRAGALLKLGALFASIGAYFIRDGYGVFLFISALLFSMSRLAPAIYRALVIALPAAAIPFGFLSDFVPAIKRNIAVLHYGFDPGLAVGGVYAALGLDALNPVTALGAFAIRMIYNLTSQAFFPVLFTTEGTVYWLGVAYWINGMFILCFFPACIAILLGLHRAPKQARILAALSIGTLFIVSLSLFVQPRYLLVITPVAALSLASQPKIVRRRYIAAGMFLSIFVYLLYSSLGVAPPAATPEALERPAYLF